MARECYTAAECAQKLGISHDGFLRIYDKLVTERKMPASRTPGRIRIDMKSFDAWQGADHPLAPRMRAANDSAPIAAPANDDEWREQLQRAYGKARMTSDAVQSSVAGSTRTRSTA